MKLTKQLFIKFHSLYRSRSPVATSQLFRSNWSRLEFSNFSPNHRRLALRTPKIAATNCRARGNNFFPLSSSGFPLFCQPPEDKIDSPDSKFTISTGTGNVCCRSMNIRYIYASKFLKIREKNFSQFISI